MESEIIGRIRRTEPRIRTNVACAVIAKQEEQLAAWLGVAREFHDACEAYTKAVANCSHSWERCECTEAADGMIRAALDKSKAALSNLGIEVS